MDLVPFMNDFIKKTKPNIRFRYALLDEGRRLMEMDRAEAWESTAVQRKQEEMETNKIIAALEKEKHDALVKEKRRKQLLQKSIELRRMLSYLATADAAKGRITQMKMEDAEIDRRFEDAAKQAQEIRAEYRAVEERQKQVEADLRRRAEELCLVLKEQMAERDVKRHEQWEERVRDGNELQERLAKLDEKDRLEEQAALRNKVLLRKAMLENLRERSEIRQNEKLMKKDALLSFYKALDEKEANEKRLKDMKDQRLKRQQALAAKIGMEILAENTARRKAIDNLIEYWANEQEIRNNLLYQQEQDKENENRRALQQSMMLQEEQRKVQAQLELQNTMELAHKRLTQSHDDSEKALLVKRMERERWENEQFLKALAEERKEKKAEELAEATTPGTVDYQINKEQEEIEATRIQVLNEQPISLLRYLPSSVVCTDYLPQPLREAVREEVRRDPIPMFNKKRHQPHLKRVKAQGGDLVKCCKACPPPKPISNIF